MARSLFGAANVNTVSASTTAAYVPLGGSNTGSTTEDQVEFKIAVAGALARPGVNVRSTAGTTRTLVLRKNNADGVNWAFGDGAAQVYVDDTGAAGSVSVAVDDRVCFSVYTSASTYPFVALFANFTRTGSAVSFYNSGVSTGVTFSTASASRNYGLGGFAGAYNDGDTNARTEIGVSGTFRGGHAFILTNGRSTNTTFTLYVDGVATAITFTVAGGVTGFVEASGLTASVTAGQRAHWQQTNGSGAGTFTFLFLGVSLEATSGTKSDVVTRGSTGVARTGSATPTYTPILGRLLLTGTTEANATIKLGFPAKLSNLRFLTGTAGYDTTITLRVGGAGSALTKTQASGASGWAADTVNEVTVAATDEVCIEVSGGTSGSTTIHEIGLTIEDLSPQNIEATFAATGQGAFAGVGAASALSALAATGTGALAAVGASTASSAFAATATGAFSGTGAVFASAAFASSATGTFAAVATADVPAYGAFSASGEGSFAATAAWTAAAAFSATAESSVIFNTPFAPPDRIGARTVITVEITGAIDAAGTLQTFYLANDRFRTRQTDSPANEFFSERLSDPGNISITAFGDGRTGGGTRLSLGEIKIDNPDGDLDGWLDYGFDGRRVVIRRGTPGAYPDDFETLYTGTADTITVDGKAVSVRLRDLQLVFAVPILTARYGGTNVLPNGIDGTEDDLAGRAKPRLYGRVFNVSPPCVNTSKLVYQISDQAIASVSGVYDRGAALVFGTDRADSGALLGTAPGAGEYDTCLAEGLIRLGSAPAGEVTVDAAAGASAVDRTAASILSTIALAAGVDPADISDEDRTALAADAPAELGIWISGESDTYARVMDQIAASVGAYYAFDATGVLRMGRLTAPAGDPVLALEEYDCLSLERRAAKDGDIPAWAVTVRHSRVWTPQTGDLAGTVTQARRTFLASEYRAQRAEDVAVKTKHLLAREISVDTLFVETADASNEASRLLALHSTRRDFFEVAVHLDSLSGASPWLMDVVQLTHPRFGLSGGRLFRVLGIRPELARKRFVFTLWG